MGGAERVKNHLRVDNLGDTSVKFWKTDAYWESRQTSKMMLFGEIVNVFQLLTIFEKNQKVFLRMKTALI